MATIFFSVNTSFAERRLLFRIFSSFSLFAAAVQTTFLEILPRNWRIRSPPLGRRWVPSQKEIPLSIHLGGVKLQTSSCGDVVLFPSPYSPIPHSTSSAVASQTRIYYRSSLNLCYGSPVRIDNNIES